MINHYIATQSIIINAYTLHFRQRFPGKPIEVLTADMSQNPMRALSVPVISSCRKHTSDRRKIRIGKYLMMPPTTLRYDPESGESSPLIDLLPADGTPVDLAFVGTTIDRKVHLDLDDVQFRSVTLRTRIEVFSAPQWLNEFDIGPTKHMMYIHNASGLSEAVVLSIPYSPHLVDLS